MSDICGFFKGPNLVLAGPGTGKTTFLINKVKQIIQDTELDGFILCTFTRKAADELKIRLFDSIPLNQMNTSTFIVGTIHSICYELLTRYVNDDYSDYQILAEDKQVHFIYSKLDNLGYSEEKIKKKGWSLSEELSKLFNKITDEEIDIDSLDSNAHYEIKDAFKAYKLYKKLLRKHNLFDFATIQETLLYHLKKDQNLRNNITAKYGYFFIDEYQDVNNIQNKIFFELAKPNYNITVVGDDDQSIYGFRGSNIEHIHHFEDLFHYMGFSVNKIILSENFRSTQNIVSFSNKLLSKANYSRQDKNIKANRPTLSHPPITRFFYNDVEEAEYICNKIKFLYQYKFISNYGQVGILFRSLKGHSQRLIEQLEKHYLPYRLISAGDLFESAMGLEYIALIDFFLSKDSNKEQMFYEKLIEIDARHNTDITTHYTQNDYIEYLNERFQSKSFFSCIDLTYDIFSSTDFLKRYENEGPNIGEITSLVLSFDDFSDYFNPYGLFSYLIYLKSSQNVNYQYDESDDRINLMTIHQAKGLEFPVVFMPSQNNRDKKKSFIDHFNELINRNSQNPGEEFRIFYVAATRPEDLLFITGSKYLTDTKKKYEPSPFLSGFLSDSPTSNDINYNLLSKQVFRNKPSNKKENVVLSYNKIRMYEICPLAYKFAHVWNLETVRIGGMEFGRNIHKIIETIIRNLINGSTLKDLDVESLVEENWTENNFQSEEQTNKFKSIAKRQIVEFITTHQNLLQPQNIFSVEDEFNVPVGNHLVTGRFDAVFQHKQNKLLLDFKTGDKQDYTSQLTFYSICFKEKYQETDVQPAVYYLKDAKLEYVTPDDENKTKKKISDIATKIENGHFIANPGKHCRDCAFYRICDQAYKKPK